MKYKVLLRVDVDAADMQIALLALQPLLNITGVYTQPSSMVDVPLRVVRIEELAAPDAQPE